jgi:hypothetical protein
MALAHSQAYNFRHWTAAYDGSNRGLPRRHRNQLKQMFEAAGWTLLASSNGGAFSNDGTGGPNPLVAGTDHWPAGDAVLAYGSYYPWVVLQCPPIMGVIQIMIHTPQPTSSNPTYWTVTTSNKGQFLASGGGTDGTGSNSPPTAPDQYLWYSNVNNGLDSSGAYTLTLTACWSADLSQFFMMSHQDRGNPHFFAFSKMENARADNPGWTIQNGMIWTIRGGDGGIDMDNTVMDNADHYTSAVWHAGISTDGNPPGGESSFYLGGRGWNNVGIQSQIRIPDNRKTVVGPCELYASSLSLRGFWGRIPDLYWAPNNQFRQGMGDSVGGLVNWFCGGSLIVPWDNTQVMPRVR